MRSKKFIDLSIDDYYKQIITNNAFNNNYIEYESKGGENKILSIKYLHIIRPCLGDIINDHKTQGEWKIQLSMTFLYLLKILMKFVPWIQRLIM